MTQRERIEEYLKINPEARERRFRKQHLVDLVLQELGLLDKYSVTRLTREEMIEFGAKYSSMDREWRAVQRENKHLRGKDYDDKTVYEQKKKMELGYEAGFHNKVKQLKMV